MGQDRGYSTGWDVAQKDSCFHRCVHASLTCCVCTNFSNNTKSVTDTWSYKYFKWCAIVSPLEKVPHQWNCPVIMVQYVVFIMPSWIWVGKAETNPLIEGKPTRQRSINQVSLGSLENYRSRWVHWRIMYSIVSQSFLFTTGDNCYLESLGQPIFWEELHWKWRAPEKRFNVRVGCSRIVELLSSESIAHGVRTCKVKKKILGKINSNSIEF